MRGYTQVKSFGLSLDKKLEVRGDMTYESGYQVAPRLLQRADRPTAIFSLNDRMAMGLLDWAQENDLRVPADYR